MATEAELTEAVEELWLRPDVTWLATRLRSDSEDEERPWPQRIDIHIKFFRALKEADCGDGVDVELVSHGKSGRAVPRYVRRRVFLEWDVQAESSSADGVWYAFTILALIPDEEGSKLWCWDMRLRRRGGVRRIRLCMVGTAVVLFRKGLSAVSRANQLV